MEIDDLINIHYIYQSSVLDLTHIDNIKKEVDFDFLLDFLSNRLMIDYIIHLIVLAKAKNVLYHNQKDREKFDVTKNECHQRFWNKYSYL
jgi:hypothetical protein